MTKINADGMMMLRRHHDAELEVPCDESDSSPR